MNLRDAATFAFNRLDHHGLTAQGWTFEFDSAVRRFGCCKRHLKKITLSSRLTLLNDEAEVRDVVLHEIAHALCPPKSGHGEVWKAMAVKVGARPQRCYDSAKVAKPAPKYVASCRYCDFTMETNRRRHRAACPRCCRKYNGGKFDLRYLITYRLNSKVTV